MVILLFVSLLLCTVTFGQKKAELVREVCDTSHWSVTNYPPRFNMSLEELNALLNRELNLSSNSADPVSFVYIAVVISCNGEADYGEAQEPRGKGDIALRRHVPEEKYGRRFQVIRPSS